MKIEVIFEDQDIVVINKPAGMVVNNAKSVEGETVQSWFDKNYLQSESIADWQSMVPTNFDDSYGSPEDVFSLRQGLVHRLDKQTSGVLLLAKNPGALVNLLAQFKQRKTQKKYLALVHGRFSITKDKIVLPMGRSKSDPTKFAIIEDGRVAETDYQVKQVFTDLKLSQVEQSFDHDKMISFSDFKKRSKIYQGFSLVECWPRTGRTHQIRVHMSAIAHPLVGDGKYVGKKRSKLDIIWCPRHFLHAQELIFTHPRSGQQQVVNAQLSKDLEKVLNLLNKEEA